MNVQTAAAGVAAAFLVTSAVLAAELLVPGQYPTVQAAIDAAVDGDTIIVAPGTYYENTDFGEKSITLTSADPNDPNTVAATILDANGSGRVVTFPDTDAQDVECMLSGFTITGGNSPGGGGIYSPGENRTITITDCVITGNTAEEGGGIFDYENHLQLLNCTFIQNSTSGRGGGMVSERGQANLTDCTFNGNSAAHDGGGIYTRRGMLTLTDCTLHGNSSDNDGGGIGSDYGGVTITNCTFSGNSADHWGGGLYNSHNTTNATNCTFSLNSAEDGGAVCTKRLYLGDLRLSNCTFYGNLADAYGGALYNWDEGNLFLTNCILWANSAYEGPQIAVWQNGSLSVSYSCLQGGLLDIYPGVGVTLDWGDGNIDPDPCFADISGGDYHLQSSAGRWDANTSVWVTDDNNSPCIDAADPCSDWTAELWSHGKRSNMGAFGGTPQASMSESDAGNIADLDFSGSVNWGDLKILTGKWLFEELLLSEDLNRDGIVNSKDFAIFADNWAWNE
ncbi:MAG: right-handed parallel beta-helix repeat-containing protein [Planctomycetota bacterium]|jgi:predicted outer membrane repeat protein